MVQGKNIGIDNKASRRKGQRRAKCVQMKDVLAEIKASRARRYWNMKGNRMKAIRVLVTRLALPPNEIMRKEFTLNGLGGMLERHYHGDIHRALVDAGFEFDKGTHWPRKKGTYDDPAHIRALIRDLAKRLGKSVTALRWKDLYRNGLNTLYVRLGGMAGIMELMGEDLVLMRSKKPDGFWKDPLNRHRAARELLRLTGKSPRAITKRDIQRAGYSALLQSYRGPDAIGRMMKEAGLLDLEVGRDEYGLRSPRLLGRWDITPDERYRVLKAFAHKIGKAPHLVTWRDLKAAGLIGLLCCGTEIPASIPALIRMCGGSSPVAETRTKHKWKDRETRIMAVRDLVKQVTGPQVVLGRRPKNIMQISRADFRARGLAGLYTLYFPGPLMELYGVKREPGKRHWRRPSRPPVAGGPRLGEHSSNDGKDHDAVPTLEDLLDCASPLIRAFVESGIIRRGSYEEWVLEKAASRLKHDPSDGVANRKTIRRAVRALGKDPQEITLKDLLGTGAKHTFESIYNCNVIRALRDAGFDVTPENKKGHKPRDYWKKKENRVCMVRKLVEAKGGPRNFSYGDLEKAGKGYLIKFAGTTDGLLREAGYDFEPWERHRCRPPYGYWARDVNRRRAIRWLIARAKTSPERMTNADFRSHGLQRLLSYYSKHPDILDRPHPGRLSSKAPLVKRILVREGFLKGDGLYGGAIPKGEKGRKAKGYERQWVVRKERPVRKRGRRKVTPKVRSPRKGRTVWKVTREKGKARIRNF